MLVKVEVWAADPEDCSTCVFVLEVFVDFYQSWHRLKKHNQFTQLFSSPNWVKFRMERKEGMKKCWVVYLSNSTRASLLLFRNVTSVTCGFNGGRFTIRVNARWQIGRRTSDLMDRSVCALRWRAWWLHYGLSIKLQQTPASTVRLPHRKIENRTNAVQDL